jgi:hypothetical protein
MLRPNVFDVVSMTIGVAIRGHWYPQKADGLELAAV